MNHAYEGLEPAEVWRHFDALNAIPRPSGHEAAAREYVRAVAAANGCGSRVDAYGNCVVYVPGNGSRSTTDSVCVQAHLDMVPAVAPGISHDFAEDPIVPQRVGSNIVASGTTLGADNGIGAALALALITDKSLELGPLELLFTVEEETGLKGASALDGHLLSSKYLVNLDSEDPDTITIGCAGGETVTLTIPIETESAPPGWTAYKIRVDGLQGGHSGVEIHKERLNALRLLAGGLSGLGAAGQFRLAWIEGGSAHNAIPREAEATVVTADTGPVSLTDFSEGDTECEPGLAITRKQVDTPAQVLTEESAATVVDVLQGIRTGVVVMSKVFPGKVQTSQNLATVRFQPDSVKIVVSLRSFVAREIGEMRSYLEWLASNAGGTAEISSGYPSWEPNANSHLLRIVMETFEQLMEKAPTVEVIHAGLECGVISAKVPGMEAISFGPLITGAHTPEEAVDYDSVRVTWRLLVESISRLA